VVHHTENESGGQSTSSLIAPNAAAPIVAIATANGRGSIGVVRVSGEDLQNFARDLTGGFEPDPRTAHYLPIKDCRGGLIDQAIVIYFKAPNSYTGEDVLEIQGHGGTAVLQLLINHCLTVGKKIGLRLAEPGEFSLRAFLNDKMDLAQAEAVADLIDASSAGAAKAAAASLSGTFSIEVKKVSDQLTSIRTLVEATLDFPEEEIEFIEKYQVQDRLLALRQNLKLVTDTSRKSIYLKDGLNVILVGEPNVGKSSILNAIFDEEISIVTDVAGTTRDRIRETLTIDGLPILITDTAGLRETNDRIEQIGIDRTWQSIEKADLILDIVQVEQRQSVLSGWPNRTEWLNKKIIKVINKTDLLNEKELILAIDSDEILVSAKTGYGIEALKNAILQVADRQVGDVTPWLGRARHIEALEIVLSHLDNALDHAQLNDRVLDLLAEELRLAHLALGSITGQVSADDLLGKIFSDFCIGK